MQVIIDTIDGNFHVVDVEYTSSFTEFIHEFFKEGNYLFDDTIAIPKQSIAAIKLVGEAK